MAKQTIGKFLSTLRKASGYTQQEVADRLGISNRTLSNWECDKVMPDILILPALAELYGVTVDEILGGARKQIAEVEFTDKSRKDIFKSKLAWFSMRSWLLVGLIIAATVCALLGVILEVSNASQYGFHWWLILLIGGFVADIICIAILFAYWKSAETFVDDSISGHDAYCILLRQNLANSLYVISVILLVLVLVTMLNVVAGGIWALIISLIALCLPVCFFVTGWVMYRQALIRWGGEKAKNHMSATKKYIRNVALIGIIPFVLGAGLITVFRFWKPQARHTIYENVNRNAFVAYMETFTIGDMEISLPLSELAKVSAVGEYYELDDGYSYYFQDEEEVCVSYGNYDDEYYWSGIAYKMSTPDGSFSVYNARFSDDVEAHVVVTNGWQYLYGSRSHYELELRGNGAAYVLVITQNYYMQSLLIGFVIIFADILTCLVLCVKKRNSFKVKL